ncbi:MAG: PIG-L family deacetylase [Nocardioidaceae bacterium]|nr:PIG-L family deacetylase [Nocardioidaceae bacterium]
MATIVSLHAHPDDEALLTGGWLAQRAAAGDRVVIVFATDGDAGLAGTSYAGRLGRARRDEGLAAARALGVQRICWLDYADSGMADTPTAGPGRLADAPVDDVAARVAAILDEEQADVVTGYDEHGGYGHPDHLAVHRVARKAQSLAASRPLLLEATVDRTWLVRLFRVLRPVARLMPGLTIPGDDVYAARDTIDRRVDVAAQLDAKRSALAAHRSQAGGGIRTVAVLLRLPRPLARLVLGREWFVEVG